MWLSFSLTGIFALLLHFFLGNLVPSTVISYFAHCLLSKVYNENLEVFRKNSTLACSARLWFSLLISARLANFSFYTHTHAHTHARALSHTHANTHIMMRDDEKTNMYRKWTESPLKMFIFYLIAKIYEHAFYKHYK